ncbi:uncharacterized [Tachysurus ichikawai]
MYSAITIITATKNQVIFRLGLVAEALLWCVWSDWGRWKSIPVQDTLLTLRAVIDPQQPEQGDESLNSPQCSVTGAGCGSFVRCVRPSRELVFLLFQE